MEFVVSDDHPGLVSAIDRHFQGALWQRCQVHFLRNVLAHVSKKDRGWAVDQVRGITTPHNMITGHRVADFGHMSVSEGIWRKVGGKA